MAKRSFRSVKSAPRIELFDPPVAARGAVVTIRGRGFAGHRAGNTVTIGKAKAEVLAAREDELRVLVPPSANSGPLTVQVGRRMAKGPHVLKLAGYPAGAGDDGPPMVIAGAGGGAAWDVDPIGIVRVLVVICQTRDLMPADPAGVRATVNNRWADVRTFYQQASYGRTDLRHDIAPGIATLDGNFTEFVDLVGIRNIIGLEIPRISAIAADHAQREGVDLNLYQMLCCVVFTNGGFVRARVGGDVMSFAYDDGLPTTDPAHISINITLTHPINLLFINESANWGRFAHEVGHNIVTSPLVTGYGVATLREDVYGTDLVDPAAATAEDFEMMGAHETHPIFTGYHLENLRYYEPANIHTLEWNRSPHSEEVDIVAHALSENTDPARVHIVKIRVSDALTYFVEVRQQPGVTAQIFDDMIPVAAAANLGGVIVTRVISGEMNNNQQTRFITLMHPERVQVAGDVIEDPARALKITVLSDSIQARPLVCRVRVEWAQTVADDPTGAFDLSLTPWDSAWQSPDIWVDRDPIGTFDNPLDAEGRPTGNGDEPRVNHVNQFTARVRVSGAMGADNVMVTFYAISPPGVGDNGNWAPIATRTIPMISMGGHAEVFCNWVPVIDLHTCLKVYVTPQFGEISGSNNSAQENIFNFRAAGSSPVDPVRIVTAIRNPSDTAQAIHMAVKGLPRGWKAQIPNAWVRLEGKGERQVDVWIWPTEDLSAYALGKGSKKRLPAVAEVKVVGTLQRNYGKRKDDPKGEEPASRMLPIGGVSYRIHVRRRATISMTAKHASKGGRLSIAGRAHPLAGGQRVLIDVLLPDGKTRRTMETKTDRRGAFKAVLDPKALAPKQAQGAYRVQARIFNASELADAESALVFVPA